MNFDDCVNFFVSNAKTDRMLGFEYETIPININEPGKPVTYYGEKGLHTLLIALQDYGYSSIIINKFLAGVIKGKIKITLEPGGQVEFACDPESKVAEISHRLNTSLSDMRAVCGEQISLHSVGYHPFCSTDEVSVIPCPRYQNITRLLNGCDNQKLTASMQCSLDYSNRTDAGKRMKLASLIQPYLIGFFGNSFLYKGQYSGFVSYRTKCLRAFDKDRSGTPDFIWSSDFFSSAYELYTEWAFQKELFYIIRDDEVNGMNTITFQDYLARDENDAHLGDWIAHLSTLYPDARLKNVIELRSCDSCPPDRAMIFLSVIKGLMYCDDILDESLHLVRKMTKKDVAHNYSAIAKNGLFAIDHSGKPVRKMVQEIANLAIRGLENIGCEDEREYVKSIGKKIICYDSAIADESCKIA
ncbi:glutamate-cysteine ligase family protein [Prodigiosinella aquatilis]|nr:glutamate-cysteine ligase family protein [Prodigiosinella sp. LS101]WJV54120.1 glutamate-cysteine ligase family protein [Prodigiosinella sp. LS101]WJV58483.1 glutamate-cysteine ligase family protein [Pectobacteriaceae bacterium C111]